MLSDGWEDWLVGFIPAFGRENGAYDAPYGRRTRGLRDGGKMSGRKCYLFIIPRWKDCGLLGASYAQVRAGAVQEASCTEVRCLGGNGTFLLFHAGRIVGCRVRHTHR